MFARIVFLYLPVAQANYLVGNVTVSVLTFTAGILIEVAGYAATLHQMRQDERRLVEVTRSLHP